MLFFSLVTIKFLLFNFKIKFTFLFTKDIILMNSKPPKKLKQKKTHTDELNEMKCNQEKRKSKIIKLKKKQEKGTVYKK